MTRRDLANGLTTATFVGASIGWAKSAVAGEKALNPIDLLDLELRGQLDRLQPMVLNADSLAEFRRPRALPTALPPPGPQPESLNVPGRTGHPHVRVLLVDPSPGETNRPAVLHMHGGGLVLGTPEQDVRALQHMAAALGAVVVSPDYRLAPETPFPGGLEDNYAVLAWLHDQAPSLGIDPTRIAISGQSAGGCHAASLALIARDRGRYPIAYQLLIYPMLDDRTGSSRPARPHMGTFVWPREANAFAWSAYLGMPAGGPSAPRGAVPARTQDLTGLPPTFIGVGALDLFAQEDLDYAGRLIDAGVPTEVVVVPGAPHGFVSLLPDSRLTRAFMDKAEGALARAFRREPSAG